jgi:hypothetical protein
MYTQLNMQDNQIEKLLILQEEMEKRFDVQQAEIN